MFGTLAKAINGLTDELRELRCGQTNAILNRLAEMENKIMATQAQLAADLKAVLEQQVKTAGEIAAVQAGVDTLKAKVAELEAVIAAGGEATQELTDAVAAVKAQAQVVDDLIPDAPAPTPPPEG